MNRYTVLLRRYQNQPHASSSSQSALSTPGLIAPSENGSVYGEDDSDTQSFGGAYGFDGSMSLRNSPAPLSTSGDSDLWGKQYPGWGTPDSLPVSDSFSSAALQPPTIASSNYWNWTDSNMPAIPAPLDPSLMDFDLMNPTTTKADPYFQLAPAAIPSLSTSYATSNPMYTPTSTSLHRRAHSGFNSSPASPSLRATALGAHLRRPNSANYTSNPPDPQYMAQFMAAMQQQQQGPGAYRMG